MSPAVATCAVDGIHINNILRGGNLAKAASVGTRRRITAFEWILLIQMPANGAVEAIPSTRAISGIIGVVYANPLYIFFYFVWRDHNGLLLHSEGLEDRGR